MKPAIFRRTLRHIEFPAEAQIAFSQPVIDQVPGVAVPFTLLGSSA
jgi:hypothetical protein